MEKKEIFTMEFAEIIKDALQTAPDSQLSEKLKNESLEFFSSEKSLVETYTYLDYISKQPVTEASQFVKTLCNVSEFYVKPKI